ncbi:hypothetical protein NQ315_006012 [Exocentrus adspersus]|uniref:SCP domain-containing protein n=1 Tax=Exocentrus adspersus TaxID=1586481 RepID=A0AAV8V762_9CUCU|nr:hypothetical protein NQ315_006012 [Exocentrus adspersus]
MHWDQAKIIAKQQGCMYLYPNVALVGSSIQHESLSSYLSLKKSQLWLKNQTEKWQSSNPYCRICCMKMNDDNVGKLCGKHTMCIYSDRPGPTCKGFISIKFTENEIIAIMDIHNTIRNWVAMGQETRGNPGPQPSASNMRVVEWDAKLALSANRWAAQCVFAHDLCRDLAIYPVGQNIAKGNYALNNDLSFIVDWYDAVDMFGFDEIPSYQLKNPKMYPAASQYTQLIWAETYRVGCARVAFQRTEGANLTYREHLVCNYGPSGNIPNQPIYKIGSPCSECPEGTGCGIEYPGLCSRENIQDMKYKGRPSKPVKLWHLENSSQINCCNDFILVLLRNKFHEVPTDKIGASQMCLRTFTVEISSERAWKKNSDAPMSKRLGSPINPGHVGISGRLWRKQHSNC